MKERINIEKLSPNSTLKVNKGELGEHKGIIDC